MESVDYDIDVDGFLVTCLAKEDIRLLQSIYVTRDRVILKFEARVQIYMAVLNICCEIQNSDRSVVRFSKINSYGISFLGVW